MYREQGVSIHDKHVEVIVRQMLRRVGVSEPGDSEFLPGQKADARLFADTNRHLVAEGKQPAEGRPELMGITKASLATDSWLSAASFQETTRVLTEAAIEGRKRRAVRAQGERDHRQAHPGRYGHERATATSRPTRPTTSRCPSTRRTTTPAATSTSRPGSPTPAPGSVLEAAAEVSSSPASWRGGALPVETRCSRR